MFTEDDLLPISALQHLVFCERQCALIHVERMWADNRLTVEGGHLHERVHEKQGLEVRGEVRTVRGLTLRSFRLGLAGVADVVEFHPADVNDPAAIKAGLSGWSGTWRAVPVEYKRGRAKPDACDAVQLGAQAMCLEEMLGGAVAAGAIFYGATRRRTDIPMDEELRSTVETAAERLHALIAAGRTPTARYEKKCDSCSLVELCMPQLLTRPRSVARYLSEVVDRE